jgi:heme ABC exporter ATP-binding subunit CcmA
MITLREVSKHFGRFTALRDLSLDVAAGETVALFGRNGAGKTTLLRIVAGLARPSSGVVELAGASSPRAARGVIGYLSHSTALYPDLTAMENLAFYASLYGLDPGEGALRSRIADVGLAGREDEPVRNYSRGMQQRLALARAFLHDPAILLLDEPFTGLDREGSAILKSFLDGCRARGRTCMVAIHDVAVGYELSSRLVVIERGKVALDLERAAVPLEEFERRYDRMVQRHGE